MVSEHLRTSNRFHDYFTFMCTRYVCVKYVFLRVGERFIYLFFIFFTFLVINMFLAIFSQRVFCRRTKLDVDCTPSLCQNYKTPIIFRENRKTSAYCIHLRWYGILNIFHISAWLLQYYIVCHFCSFYSCSISITY